MIDDGSPKQEETHYWLSLCDNTYGSMLDIIIIYQEKNAGAGDARNAGWNVAKGKYIAFLDSDDIWHPQKLAIQYAFMESHPEFGFSCHHMNVLSENDIESFSRREIPYSKDKIIPINPVRYLFLHYPIGGTPSVMVKNVPHIRFIPGKRYSEDYLIWLEYCFRYGGALLNVYMAASFKAFFGEAGLSGNLWKIEKGEMENYQILREKKLISYPLSLAAQFFSFLKFVRRMIICICRS